MPDERPLLSDDEDLLEEARDAVDAFVAELQAGVDARDADVFNAHFADDVAQVRRVAFGEDGAPVPDTDPATFSELTTFVLVRRAGEWWLAAGQHTPVRPKPS